MDCTGPSEQGSTEVRHETKTGHKFPGVSQAGLLGGRQRVQEQEQALWEMQIVW